MSYVDGCGIRAAVQEAMRVERRLEGNYGYLEALDGRRLRAATREEQDRAAEEAVRVLDPDAPILVDGLGQVRVREY